MHGSRDRSCDSTYLEHVQVGFLQALLGTRGGPGTGRLVVRQNDDVRGRGSSVVVDLPSETDGEKKTPVNGNKESWEAARPLKRRSGSHRLRPALMSTGSSRMFSFPFLLVPPWAPWPPRRKLPFIFSS